MELVTAMEKCTLTLYFTNLNDADKAVNTLHETGSKIKERLCSGNFTIAVELPQMTEETFLNLLR